MNAPRFTVTPDPSNPDRRPPASRLLQRLAAACSLHGFEALTETQRADARLATVALISDLMHAQEAGGWVAVLAESEGGEPCAWLEHNGWVIDASAGAITLRTHFYATTQPKSAQVFTPRELRRKGLKKFLTPAERAIAADR